MENTVTRIAELPNDTGEQHVNLIQQPQTINVNNTKAVKLESDLPTNYMPINVHPNPYGISEQRQMIETPAHSLHDATPRMQPLSQEQRDQLSNTPIQHLPSRDIPQDTPQYSNDPRVQSNYIPPPPTQTDYVREQEAFTEHKLKKHEQQKEYENTVDYILSELQVPIFVGILFFAFQLPATNNWFIKHLSFLNIYSSDGNYNFTGLLIKSIIFGSSYYTLSRSIKFLSEL